MLSRIRNASTIGLEKAFVPFTKVNLAISKILRDEGFIESFEKVINCSGFYSICINLKFKKGSRQKAYISFLKRVSKPGLRVYVNSNNIPDVWGGIGVAVFGEIRVLLIQRK